jgi:hypothetical protein
MSLHTFIIGDLRPFCARTGTGFRRFENAAAERFPEDTAPHRKKVLQFVIFQAFSPITNSFPKDLN